MKVILKSAFHCHVIHILFSQAATNMFNEYYDYKKGLDDHESVGIGGAIVRNGMSPRACATISHCILHLSSNIRFVFSC